MREIITAWLLDEETGVWYYDVQWPNNPTCMVRVRALALVHIRVQHPTARLSFGISLGSGAQVV